MSPMRQTPKRGYGDFDRVDDWDTDALATYSNQALTTPVVTSKMDVSRSAYIGGYALPTAGDMNVVIKWWSDINLTLGTGIRQFNLTSSIGDQAQFRLPNLGAFAQATFTQISAAAATFSAVLIGTNRSHPLEIIPEQWYLLNTSSNVNAGATVHYYPVDYYAGPVRLATYSTQATGQLVPEMLSNNGTWVVMDIQPSLATATWQQWDLVTPPGAWRISMVNGAGSAATMYAIATYSTTGSV